MKQKTFDDFETSGVECPTCGRDDFESGRGMKWHHSVMHNESIRGWDLDCEICNKTFTVYQNPEERKYCSRECLTESQRDYQSCKYCGEQYLGAYNDSGGEYCSRECHSKDSRESVTCKWCGEVISVPQSEGDRKYCSMDCKGEAQSQNQKGKNNPYWRGGRDFYTRVRANLSDTSWRDRAKQARKRHNHKCFHCGTDQDDLGRKLDVHHIVPVMDGGDNGLWNLVPLCNDCHKEVEWYTVNKITGKEPLLSDRDGDNNKQRKPDRGGHGE